jgi:hypothetical protein
VVLHPHLLGHDVFSNHHTASIQPTKDATATATATATAAAARLSGGGGVEQVDTDILGAEGATPTCSSSLVVSFGMVPGTTCMV